MFSVSQGEPGMAPCLEMSLSTSVEPLAKWLLADKAIGFFVGVWSANSL